jgi:HSP20 family protein
MSRKVVETKKAAPSKPHVKQEVIVPPVRKNEYLPSLFGFTPFSLMRRFTDNLERLFEDFNHFRLIPFIENELTLPHWTDVETVVWSPQIEILEKDGKLHVRADLPGMKKEDIEIEVTDDSLIISGERRHESKEKREGYYRTERSYGSFYREVPLPEGTKTENAHAVFQNGVLEVTMQVPAKQPKGKKLEISETAEKEKAKAAAG